MNPGASQCHSGTLPELVCFTDLNLDENCPRWGSCVGGDIAKAQVVELIKLGPIRDQELTTPKEPDQSGRP